jgi:hypothetical protein
MRIETLGGLRGTLIKYQESGKGYGVAIVQRDDAPVATRPYSTHRVWDEPGIVGLTADLGTYDLSWADAQADFARRIT